MARTFLILSGMLFVFLLMMGCSSTGQDSSPGEPAPPATASLTLNTPAPTIARNSIVGRYRNMGDISRTAEFRENGQVFLNEKGFERGAWEKGILQVNLYDISRATIEPGNGYVVTLRFSDFKGSGPRTVQQQVNVKEDRISFLEAQWIPF